MSPTDAVNSVASGEKKGGGGGGQKQRMGERMSLPTYAANTSHRDGGGGGGGGGETEIETERTRTRKLYFTRIVV